MNVHLASCFLPFSENISFDFITYSNLLNLTSSCVLNKLLSPISDELLCSETDLFACLVELLLLLWTLLLLHRQHPDQSLRNNWIISITAKTLSRRWSLCFMMKFVSFCAAVQTCVVWVHSLGTSLSWSEVSAGVSGFH